jgi:hypothetical protein
MTLIGKGSIRNPVPDNLQWGFRIARDLKMVDHALMPVVTARDQVQRCASAVAESRESDPDRSPTSRWLLVLDMTTHAQSRGAFCARNPARKN